MVVNIFFVNILEMRTKLDLVHVSTASQRKHEDKMEQMEALPYRVSLPRNEN